jgi:hypothetical protein
METQKALKQQPQQHLQNKFIELLKHGFSACVGAVIATTVNQGNVQTIQQPLNNSKNLNVAASTENKVLGNVVNFKTTLGSPNKEIVKIAEESAESLVVDQNLRAFRLELAKFSVQANKPENGEFNVKVIMKPGSPNQRIVYIYRPVDESYKRRNIALNQFITNVANTDEAFKTNFVARARFQDVLVEGKKQSMDFVPLSLMSNDRKSIINSVAFKKYPDAKDVELRNRFIQNTTIDGTMFTVDFSDGAGNLALIRASIIRNLVDELNQSKDFKQYQPKFVARANDLPMVGFNGDIKPSVANIKSEVQSLLQKQIKKQPLLAPVMHTLAYNFSL